MSSDEDKENPYIDTRPQAVRMSVGALEHIALGNRDSDEWRRLAEKYPELEYPGLWYSFVPDKQTAMSIYSELEREINWRWGSGRRRHTGSEFSEKLMILSFIRLRLLGSLGGFERIQANSTTVNQTHTVREEKRDRRSLNPFKKSR